MIGRSSTAPASPSPTTYLLVAAAILGGVVAAHLLPTRAGDSYVLSALFDVAHVVGFAAITALVGVVVLREAPTQGVRHRMLLPLIGAVVLGLAALAESLQFLSSRNASVGDVMRDACGIAAGLTVVLAARAPRRRSALLLGLAAILAGAALERPAGTVAAFAAARLDGDAASGFDGRYQRRLLVARDASLTIVPAPADWPRGGRVLRVAPHAGAAIAGFTYHGLPSSWSGFERLRFTIAAEHGEPTELLLRIEGPRIDHFRRRRSRIRISVAETPREVSIPMTTISAVSSPEAFDNENVYGVSLLATDSDKPSFMIDGFRLE